ncbi:uncharacterized protein LOC107272872 [Cephus cinctus]|uniref:Aminopeptidase N n=1 Tax=Cephus cinctus TaxID=211228 RepID=A0AAJ7RRU1_CEPCN|nr:uncharacterized protein LOC107272872 [Cephus cinctus]
MNSVVFDMHRSGFTIGVLATLVVLASGNPIEFEKLSINAVNLRDNKIYRLADNVIPTNYTLKLVPYISDQSFVFTGEVEIDFIVTSLTNTIILHALDITINENKTALHSKNVSSSLSIHAQSYDPIREFFLITFKSNLPPGNYSLHLSYTGHLGDDMFGFYRSYYDVGTERRWLASTQFQPTYARRAFPCFDEPRFKTPFDISIAHFANQTASSNMPGDVNTTVDNTIGGRIWTTFQQTPPISTYLLAFVVSDFTSTTNVNSNFSIWSRSAAASARNFSFVYGEKQYLALQDYLGVSDPIPKIDQFAIPDFSAGAMENWGIITYRERLLLWYDGVSTPRDQENVATVMSHEFGHNWFGNLVSPEWWDYLWMNEGFASYFEYFATSLVHTDWRLMERFVVYALQPVLVLDSLESSRPMTNSVGSSASVLGSFDRIAYSKAASVLRMLNHIMSEPLFNQALTNYLNERALNVTTPKDLWRHMQAVSETNSHVQAHTNMEDIFNTWVNQPGYPVLNVGRNYSTTVVVLTQERFFLNPRSPTADPDAQRWWIPINFATPNSLWRFDVTNSSDWFRPQDGSLIISGFGPTNWVIFNTQQSGYFRVNYDPINWYMIIDQLKGENYTVIPPVNRASLIDDSLNFARAGYINYSLALDLTTYLEHEDDYVPWYAAWTNFGHLNRMLARNKNYALWEAYVRKLIEPSYNNLTWTVSSDDDHVTRLQRGQVLNWACNFGVQGCREEAITRFNNWISNSTNTIHPDVKSVAYCWGINNADQATWDIVWNRFLENDISTEEVLLLSSLGCSEDPAILQKYLELSITPDSGIRSQDSASVFNSVLNGPNSNLEVALNFIATNFTAISEFYGGLNSVANMLTAIGNRITTEDQLIQLKIFTTANNFGAAQASVASTIQLAESNMEWLSDNADSIFSWLEDQNLPIPSLPIPPVESDASPSFYISSMLITLMISLTMITNNFMMGRTGLLLVALLLGVVNGTPINVKSARTSSKGISAKETAQADNDYRLPNNTIPISYEVKLVPYLEENIFTFTGSVSISVSVVDETDSIVLHADSLNIISTSVVNSNGSVLNVNSTTFNKNLNFFIISFKSTLTVGNYVIRMMFDGKLNDEMYGFYRSYYYTDTGKKRWLATTQFEPVYARSAFPCFDEPALKAYFSISIAHHANQSAVSNMPNIEISEPDSTIGNRVWSTFRTTPLMSTYLLAFVVSDFQHISTANDTFRVWSRSNALNIANYSLEVGLQELNSLSAFTGYNYNRALPKMDEFAIPDFSAGAMENWGLVTYRERLLLWKSGVSTSRNKQSIASVVSHEFAHQWFGNLVGPLWWKYLWLNEGFATYFEYYTTSSVETSWCLMDQFTLENYHTAFLIDSLDTSHPINQDVNSPSEINSIFDTISYQKGGSIIRMMSHFFGETMFRKGLQTYIANMAFGAATPDDLWYALELVTNTSAAGLLPAHVSRIMDTWTERKGYPLVTILRNYSTGVHKISQERFLLKGRGSSNDTTRYKWWVPMNSVSRSTLNFLHTYASFWLSDFVDDSYLLSEFLPTDWVIYNIQQTGYYRVNYDDTNWQLITDYLRTADYQKIHVLNRAQLIDDALNLARSGYLKYDIALNLTTYLSQEVDYVPWTAAFTNFGYLKKMLSHSTGYEFFKSYISSLVTPLHKKLSYEESNSDDHLTKLNRLNILSWSCQMGSAECVNKAENILLDYYSSPDPDNYLVPPDLKAWVYCEGLRNLNSSVWKFLLDRYYATDLSTEQTLILSSLGCSLNEQIITDYLLLSIREDSGIRSQDTYYIFTSVTSGSMSNVDIAFDFLSNHYTAISNFYGGQSNIGNMLNNLGQRMVSNEQVTKLKAFVAQHSNDLGTAAAAAERAIELAEENIAWLNNYETDIVSWLTIRNPSSSATKFTLSIAVAVFSLIVFRIL